MTDEVSIGDIGSQNLSAPQQAVDQSQERMVPQSEVNRLLGSEKKETYSKAYAEGLRASQSGGSNSASMPDSAKIADDVLQRIVSHASVLSEQQEKKKAEMASQERQRQQDENAARIAAEFSKKLSDSGKFENVRDVLNGLSEDSRTSQREVDGLILALNELDNAADVTKYLYEDPDRYDKILSAFVKSPRNTKNLLKQAAETLKENQQAKQANYREPLSQVKSSIGGIDNGSERSISDRRRDPKYKM